MSNETKNTSATEAAAEVKAEAKTEGTTPAKSEGKTKKETKPKAEAKSESKPKAEAGGALKSVGLAACKRHGLAEVWVTSDGQSFGGEGDAKAHAANLSDKTILNVKSK